MPIHVSALSIIVLVCMFRKWLTQQQILNLITLKKTEHPAALHLLITDPVKTCFTN